MTEGPVETRHEGVRFEKTDVEPRAIVRFGIVLAVVTSVVAVLLVYLLRYFAALEARNDPPPAPLAHDEAGRLPPEPRLQTQPFVDIDKLREAENEVLRGYGWVDEKAGIVRIPIDEAMRIVAQRGLQVGSGTSPPAGGAAAEGKKP